MRSIGRNNRSGMRPRGRRRLIGEESPRRFVRRSLFYGIPSLVSEQRYTPTPLLILISGTSFSLLKYSVLKICNDFLIYVGKSYYIYTVVCFYCCQGCNLIQLRVSCTEWGFPVKPEIKKPPRLWTWSDSPNVLVLFPSNIDLFSGNVALRLFINWSEACQLLIMEISYICSCSV